MIVAATAAADTPTYSSESACRRAESAEVCDRMFGEVDRTPYKADPMPLPACTGMLEESTSRVRMAVAYLRFGNDLEAAKFMDEAESLTRSALECQGNVQHSSETRTNIAAWQRAADDNYSEVQVYKAVKDARR